MCFIFVYRNRFQQLPSVNLLTAEDVRLHETWVLFVIAPLVLTNVESNPDEADNSNDESNCGDRETSDDFTFTIHNDLFDSKKLETMF